MWEGARRILLDLLSHSQVAAPLLVACPAMRSPSCGFAGAVSLAPLASQVLQQMLLRAQSHLTAVHSLPVGPAG